MARPNLSEQMRTRIVDAALRLIDAEGMEALSTRRLAQELGIRGPTLYHYFPDKDALLGAVRDRIVDEIWTGVDDRLVGVEPGDWAGVLRGYVESAVRAMGRHPNAVGFMALRNVTNRRTLRGYEDVLRRLTDCGWPLDFAWRVFLAAENLMLSAALEAGAPAFAPPATQTGDLPLVREVAARVADRPALDEGSPLGLDALIAGIAALLDLERGSAVPSHRRDRPA